MAVNTWNSVPKDPFECPRRDRQVRIATLAKKKKWNCQSPLVLSNGALARAWEIAPQAN
jgi:hypothetical protein